MFALEREGQEDVMMTVSRVRAYIDRIKRYGDDHDAEAAHSLEDRLYIRVLESVAIGVPDSSELAREALEARKIRFARWYA